MKWRQAAVAVLAAAGMTIGAPAAASAPYTVAVGGSTAPGSHPFTYFADPSLSVPGGSFAICPWSGTGRVESGSGIPGILEFDPPQPWGCTDSELIARSNGFRFKPMSGATSSTTDSITGEFSGYLQVSTAFPGICTFDVAAPGGGEFRADAVFDEASQSLAVNESGYSGDLVINNVVGCLGAISNGDPVDLSATFQIASPDGPIDYRP